MHACLPWLDAEIEKVGAVIIVALGVTAGSAMLGKLPKMSEDRGKIFESAKARGILLSWHPSAILRSMREEEKTSKKADLILDLKLALEFSKRESMNL